MEREWMRVITFALVWPPTLINSHALSSTLSWFKFSWESMRGLARLTGHESCMRIEENYKRLAVCTLQLQGSTKWPMFLSVFLTLGKNQKQAMSKSLPIIRRRKKENTYHRQEIVVSWSNDSDCQQFDKRQKTKKNNRGWKQRAKTRKSKKEME